VPKTRIQAIDPRSQATAVILVEGLQVMVNQDTVVIIKLQAVAIRNRKTIPTMLNTIRANTPSKPIPERPCPFSNPLTLLSTFLTEQDDEEHDQLHLRSPGSSLGIPHPARLGGFSHNRTHVSVTCPAQRLGLLAVRDSDFIVNYFVPHASRIVAVVVSTWLLSFW
jgi:hypothetical protein